MKLIQRLPEETAQYPISSVIQPKMTLESIPVLLTAQMARHNIWWNYEKQVSVWIWLHSRSKSGKIMTLSGNYMANCPRWDSVAEWFRALDLKSGGLWFKFSTLLLSGFVLGSPEFNSSMHCVNSQLVSLPKVGILNSLCSIWNICLLIYSVHN